MGLVRRMLTTHSRATPSRTATRPIGANGEGLLPVTGMPPRSMVVVGLPAPDPASVVVVVASVVEGAGVAVGVTHGSTGAATWRAGPRF